MDLIALRPRPALTRQMTPNGLVGLSGSEALDSESRHELSVALALARNHQDRIGNPLSGMLISRTHPQFYAGRFERSVHGFDLSIVEEFPHPLPRLKGPEPPQHASRVICLVLASEGARPETDGLQIGAEMMKSFRRAPFRPGLRRALYTPDGPSRLCHPGRCRAATRGAAARLRYDRR